MTIIGALYPAADLSNSNFSRIHLFYSLFTAIAHQLYGLNGLDSRYRKTVTEKIVPKIRIALDSVSAEYDEVVKDKEMLGKTKDFRAFVNYTRRATTDTAARKFRANYLSKKIVNSI